jgi:hypothetical protein
MDMCYVPGACRNDKHIYWLHIWKTVTQFKFTAQRPSTLLQHANFFTIYIWVKVLMHLYVMGSRPSADMKRYCFRNRRVCMPLSAAVMDWFPRWKQPCRLGLPLRKASVIYVIALCILNPGENHSHILMPQLCRRSLGDFRNLNFHYSG